MHSDTLKKVTIQVILKKYNPFILDWKFLEFHKFLPADSAEIGNILNDFQAIPGTNLLKDSP